MQMPIYLSCKILLLSLSLLELVGLGVGSSVFGWLKAVSFVRNARPRHGTDIELIAAAKVNPKLSAATNSLHEPECPASVIPSAMTAEAAACAGIEGGGVVVC